MPPDITVIMIEPVGSNVSLYKLEFAAFRRVVKANVAINEMTAAIVASM
jgi:hypothetical protein